MLSFTWIIVLAPAFLFLAWSLIPAMILVGLIATGWAGLNVSFPAVYSEAIDNAVVKTGYREEGSYLGVLRFFSATAIFWWSVIFLIVSTITGYDPSIEYTQANPPTLIQRIGLNMQVSVIPAVLLLIAILIFSKHKQLAPFDHWYLQNIAVKPEEQRKGYGGLLLRVMIKKIDSEGLPIYLETKTRKN